MVFASKDTRLARVVMLPSVREVSPIEPSKGYSVSACTQSREANSWGGGYWCECLLSPYRCWKRLHHYSVATLVVA